jgi:hypothetical protein
MASPRPPCKTYALASQNFVVSSPLISSSPFLAFFAFFFLVFFFFIYLFASLLGLVTTGLLSSSSLVFHSSMLPTHPIYRIL